MKKRSIFERLSGSIPVADDYDSFDDDYIPAQRPEPVRRSVAVQSSAPSSLPANVHDEEASDGQLPVDVYQTPNEIVIKAFIAGVRPDEVNVSISRDMVVIDGSRTESHDVSDSDFFHQELFWGSFSRTVMLPQEIDVDNSSAGAKDGLLSIVMPKLDKARQTKLKVKSA